MGFRDFIETAEIDRINELVDENPSYFYDVLPYAYVFKLSNKWIKKFETIRIPEHLGYAPHGISTFDYIRMNTLMHSIEKVHSTEYQHLIPTAVEDFSPAAGFQEAAPAVAVAVPGKFIF